MNKIEIAHHLGVQTSSIQKIIDSGLEIQVEIESVSMSGLEHYNTVGPTISIGSWGLRYDPITGGTVRAFESVDTQKFIKMIKLFESEAGS